MSESSQPSKQDPVRIVYHTGNRTFARLFNGDITSHHGRKTRLSSLHVERSLEEVKDVVRRKLGLGRETDVSLRQMIASDALLDLEDGESKKKVYQIGLGARSILPQTMIFKRFASF